MTNRRDFLRRAAVGSTATAAYLIASRAAFVPPREILELARVGRGLPTPPAGWNPCLTNTL